MDLEALLDKEEITYDQYLLYKNMAFLMQYLRAHPEITTIHIPSLRSLRANEGFDNPYAGSKEG